MVDAQMASAIVGAAEFLVGSILVCLGILVICSTLVLLNRLFTRYWVPIKLFSYLQSPAEKPTREPKLD